MSYSQFVKSHNYVKEAENFNANCLLPLANGHIVLGGKAYISPLDDYKAHIEIWDPITMKCVASKSISSNFVWYLAVLPPDLNDPATPRFATFEQQGSNAIYRFHDATLLVSSPPHFFPISGVPGFILQSDIKSDAEKLKFRWVFGSECMHYEYTIFGRYDSDRFRRCYTPIVYSWNKCNQLIPNFSININTSSQLFSTSPNGNYRIAVHKNNMVLCLREDKVEEFNIKNSHDLGIPNEDYCCSDFFPDSEHFVFATKNKSFLLFIANASKLSRYILNVDSQIYGITTIPDRYHEVITSHCDGSVRMYDFAGISEHLVDFKQECKATKMQPTNFLIPSRKTGSFFSNVQRNLVITRDNVTGQVTAVCKRSDEKRIDFFVLISYVDILNQLLFACPGIDKDTANLCVNYAGFHAGLFAPKNRISPIVTQYANLVIGPSAAS